MRISDWSSDVCSSDLGSPRQPAAAVSCDPPSESPRRSSPLFPPPDHQVPDFGHVLDGEADAFAAEPRILDAAIGPVVDAVAGHFVDDDAAAFEPIPGVQGLEKVAGEDANLEPELAVVTLVQLGRGS